MKRASAVVLFLLALMGAGTAAPTAPPAIGISLAQATDYLTKTVRMRRTAAAHGQTHFIGLSADRTAMIETVGDTHDLSEVTMIVGLPADAKAVAIRNRVMLVCFMKKVTPEWSGNADWLASALRQASARPDAPVGTIQGNKKIRVQFMMSRSMIMLTVKHR